jgi:hypothetical protein
LADSLADSEQVAALESFVTAATEEKRPTHHAAASDLYSLDGCRFQRLGRAAVRDMTGVADVWD